MPSRRYFHRSEGYTEQDLLLAASDHLEAAAVLFEMKWWWLLDSAGYLGALGFELLLKAALLYKTDRFPETHDLVQLTRECGSAFGLSLDPDSTALVERLGSFGRLRYPDPTNPVSIASEDLDSIDSLSLAVVRQLPPEVVLKLQQVREPDKDGRFRKGNRFIMFRRSESPDEDDSGGGDA